MDRWVDADDDIRNGSQKARVVPSGLDGFVKKAGQEPSTTGFSSIQVVPSKKEQRRQHAAQQMPPPPPTSKPIVKPQVHSVPGLPPLPDLPAWVSGPVPDGLYIQVVKDGSIMQEFNVVKSVTVFGRAQTVDIVLEHGSISRMHAAICVQGSTGKVFLIDLGAVHGTFAAGQRLSKGVPVELFMGAELRFGASTRRYILQRLETIKRASAGFAEEGSSKRVRLSGPESSSHSNTQQVVPSKLVHGAYSH